MRSLPVPSSRRASSACLLLCLPLLAGCQGEPPDLEVAGVAYTADELLGLAQERKLALADLASLARAVADGEAESLANPWVERRRREYLARVSAARRALEVAGVDDAVLEARYATNPALELTVRHLLVFSERYETDATRAEARAKAERALERIRAGEPFPAVAAEVSEEPGAEGREGLLTPGREGAWVPEFWSAARALLPGQISPVVETQYGFHVLRLEARDTVPFREMRAQVSLEVAELMGADLDPYAMGEADAVEPDTGALLRYLAAATVEAWERAGSDAAALAAEARRAARLHAAAAAAEASGVVVPETVEGEARREWEDALALWTYTFGFEEGAPDEALRTAALEALGATGQGPATARESLRARRPLLRYRYPVRLRAEGDPGG